MTVSSKIFTKNCINDFSPSCTWKARVVTFCVIIIKGLKMREDPHLSFRETVFKHDWCPAVHFPSASVHTRVRCPAEVRSTLTVTQRLMLIQWPIQFFQWRILHTGEWKQTIKTTELTDLFVNRLLLHRHETTQRFLSPATLKSNLQYKRHPCVC